MRTIFHYPLLLLAIATLIPAACAQHGKEDTGAFAISAGFGAIQTDAYHPIWERAGEVGFLLRDHQLARTEVSLDLRAAFSTDSRDILAGPRLSIKVASLPVHVYGAILVAVDWYRHANFNSYFNDDLNLAIATGLNISLHHHIDIHAIDYSCNLSDRSVVPGGTFTSGLGVRF